MKKIITLIATFSLMGGYAHATIVENPETLTLHQNHNETWDTGTNTKIKNIENTGPCRVNLKGDHAINIQDAKNEKCEISVIYSNKDGDSIKNLSIKPL